jgi:hypothetical protein
MSVIEHGGRDWPARIGITWHGTGDVDTRFLWPEVAPPTEGEVVYVHADQLQEAVDRVAEVERQYDALRWLFKREFGRAPAAAQMIEARRAVGGQS